MLGVRSLRMGISKVALILLAVLCLCCSPGESIDCLFCKSCSRIIEETFTVTCEQEFTKCLKAELISGEIERVCATEDSCSLEGKKAAYENVYCCDEDNCNGGSMTAPGILLGLPILALVTNALRHFPQ
eukprot:TRINITY_DN15884_c0_g1_i1.p1 TRINITY_DN15884_c0_g1~~TRINITY_DN15884_c0_g1_i1.p1  ORF type:complete len:129 (+),score=19.19 TRINITY_DN15884_c0_g1_i1:200-586(+)